jgi:hypothetical protein
VTSKCFPFEAHESRASNKNWGYKWVPRGVKRVTKGYKGSQSDIKWQKQWQFFRWLLGLLCSFQLVVGSHNFWRKSTIHFGPQLIKVNNFWLTWPCLTNVDQFSTVFDKTFNHFWRYSTNLD